MPHITRALLRRRAEHNEGQLGTLEELTLHQEELEGINEVLGASCRRLKILYLQNNVIDRLRNLHHLKQLEYLNVALNNITRIEGLGSCEFLRKLDLTLNFIDFDELAASVEHLARLPHLQDLFMLGNPAAQRPWWQDGGDADGGEEAEPDADTRTNAFVYYVAHRLPQLGSLDGKEITHSLRLCAARVFPVLEARLSVLAAEVREAKVAKEAVQQRQQQQQQEEKDARKEGDEEEEEEEELTVHDPATRTKMYLEVAAQKQERAERQRLGGMAPPPERDMEGEQSKRVAEVRASEAGLKKQTPAAKEDGDGGEIKQKNEGKWRFSLRDADDDGPLSSSSSSSQEQAYRGCVLLEVPLPRYLDSSLIDVDVHPTWVSLVVKAKLLRLKLPEEVRACESHAKRSKTTGHLLVVMPKARPKAVLFKPSPQPPTAAATTMAAATGGKGAATRRKPLSLAEEMLRVGGQQQQQQQQQQQKEDEPPLLKGALCVRGTGSNRAKGEEGEEEGGLPPLV